MSGKIIDERQLKELMDSLNELPDKIQKNIVRSAVRSGAAVIRDAIKQSLDGVENRPQNRTGKLKKSIKVKSIRGKKDTVQFKVKIGVLQDFKQKETGAYRHVNYGNQLEFGNSRLPAHPFVRPVFDSLEKEILDSVEEKIKVRIDLVNNSKGGKNGWE